MRNRFESRKTLNLQVGPSNGGVNPLSDGFNINNVRNVRNADPLAKLNPLAGAEAMEAIAMEAIGQNLKVLNNLSGSSFIVFAGHEGSMFGSFKPSK